MHGMYDLFGSLGCEHTGVYVSDGLEMHFRDHKICKIAMISNRINATSSESRNSVTGISCSCPIHMNMTCVCRTASRCCEQAPPSIYLWTQAQLSTNDSRDD